VIISDEAPNKDLSTWRVAVVVARGSGMRDGGGQRAVRIGRQPRRARRRRGGPVASTVMDCGCGVGRRLAMAAGGGGREANDAKFCHMKRLATFYSFQL